MTAATRSTPRLRIYLEEGRRRTFAMAIDWPGWGRSGRDAAAAVEALVAYRSRYAVVVDAARSRRPPFPTSDPTMDVVSRVAGNATTDFGAPGVVPAFDAESWTPDEARRQTDLLVAAWARLDAAAAAAPAELRKGPRGGGRDRNAIVEHVLGTESAYARKAGLTIKAPSNRSELDELRRLLVELLQRSPGPAGTASGWPAPYVVRRLAWHALDHTWEIEDRGQPADVDALTS